MLDISDSEFQFLMQSNPRVSELLEKRRRGELEVAQPELRTCPSCQGLFIPYGGARCSSDECAWITRITSHRR